MKNQERIFVIGHKNPDTDSICSAIAYADIKNRTSQKVKYVAKRAGQINEETEYVLNRFGMQPPGYLSNIGTQVKDMDIRMSPEADKSMSLKNAWDLMMEKSIVSLPIRDREGQLEGLITIGDIAKTYMDTTDSYLLSRAKTQYKRIAETIGGTVIEGNEHGYFVNGKVMVGTANPEMLKAYVEEDDLIIMGDREEDHLQAIAQNVSCIIVGMGIEVTEKVIKLAHERQIIIIRSPYDTFTIARLINQSIPVKYIMKTDNLVTFSTEDFTDDIQNEMIKHRHRAFPVINKKGKCIGTISRRNFLDMHKKKVALVDHNEKDQAVDNIEKAEIMEIIDHADMTDRARSYAKKIFTILAHAEAKAHNVPEDMVHFHEVGAVDSIVDILSVAICMDDLDVEEVIVPRLCEGSGTIRCQHGILPVPVPAVSNIVSAHHLKLHITPVQGELVTPTGAAVVAAFLTSEKLPEDFTVEKIGIGAGKRQYECPGILRAMLIRESGDVSGADVSTETDTIVKLESNIDDCTGETLGYVMERLYEAGAREANYMPVFMKKNRPAWLLTVLCKREQVPTMEQIIFRETTTIGIRRQEMERTILKREKRTVTTPLGEVEVKVCTFDGQEYFYPEYESVKKLCEKTGISYKEAYHMAVRG